MLFSFLPGLVLLFSWLFILNRINYIRVDPFEFDYSSFFIWFLFLLVVYLLLHLLYYLILDLFLLDLLLIFCLYADLLGQEWSDWFEFNHSEWIKGHIFVSLWSMFFEADTKYVFAGLWLLERGCLLFNVENLSFLYFCFLLIYNHPLFKVVIQKRFDLSGVIFEIFFTLWLPELADQPVDFGTDALHFHQKQFFELGHYQPLDFVIYNLVKRNV